MWPFLCAQLHFSRCKEFGPDGGWLQERALCLHAAWQWPFPGQHRGSWLSAHTGSPTHQGELLVYLQHECLPPTRTHYIGHFSPDWPTVQQTSSVCCTHTQKHSHNSGAYFPISNPKYKHSHCSQVNTLTCRPQLAPSTMAMQKASVSEVFRKIWPCTSTSRTSLWSRAPRRRTLET